MTTISGEVYLKISNDSDWEKERFFNGMKTGDHAEMIAAGFISTYEGGGSATMVAKGTVTLDLMDESTITENAIASLKEHKSQILAEAQAKATQIEGQIQKLLAIEFTQ